MYRRKKLMKEEYMKRAHLERIKMKEMEINDKYLFFSAIEVFLYILVK